MAFLSRHATKVTVEGASQLEARFDPSPCCKRDGARKKAAAATCINTQSGLWHCWSCGAVGNWFTLTRAFGEPLSWEDRFVDLAPPVDFRVYDRVRGKMRRPVSGGHHPELLAYAMGRGFSIATLDAWRVTTKGPATLRWPMFALEHGKWQIANARLRVCLGRAEAETKDWFEVRGGPVDLLIGYHLLGARPPNYEIPHNDKPGCADGGDPKGEVGLSPKTLPELPRRVLICEGQWDAMTAWELGIPNALSLPNGANNVAVASMLRYVPDDYEVWLALDMDAPGDRAAEMFFAQLGPERVARLHLPFKDLNEWLLKEPDLTAERVLATAKGLTPTLAPRAVAAREASKLTHFVSIADEDEAGDADVVICQLPWERLTDLLGGGLRATQTTGILAPSGIGKTTVVNQIAVHAAKQEVTVGIISLESSRAAVRTKLRDQVRGWTHYIGEAFKAVCSRLLLSELEGSDVKWEDCLEELETMIAQGAKLIVWDNPDYQMPRRASNPSAIKLEAYARFQQLCKRHGVHGIVVWQPNKIDRDKVINSGDQKGMAQALQDSDNYLNLNRIGNMRRIEVEKTRAEGALDGGRFCWIKYDPQTRCLTEQEHHASLTPVAPADPEARPELI